MIEPFNSCQMAACEVSQIISSIVSAYNSGLDVFKRLKCKKRSKPSKDTKTAHDEALLQSSLQYRPRDIRIVYDNNVKQFGHRFEIGDTIAHSSLAHTLLVLNSGLVGVLNSSISDDVVKRRQSRRSLLGISEVAAADALYALGQLNYRLTTYQSQIPVSLPMRVAEPKAKRTSHTRKPSKTIVDIQVDPKVKTRAENNLLVRGGWVRPCPPRTKSGSTVSTATSSRNTSTTKLAELNRSPKGSPRPRHSRAHSAPMSSVPIVPPQPQPMAELPGDNQPRRRHHSPEHRRIHREPSMLIMPADIFESQLDLATPRPRKIPLHSRPTSTIARPSTGTRPRPPSVATFMSASTKIGEIPESRWPDRIPQAGEALRPLPYVLPPPLNIEELPRKKKGLRFWKKSEPVGQAVVY
jgi:hypothetical protein